jgi:hypothetical protein
MRYTDPTRRKLHKWKLRTFSPAPEISPALNSDVTASRVNLLDYDRKGLRDLFAQLGENRIAPSR